MTKIVTPFIEEIYHDLCLSTEAYHGGRNEQFIFGIADEADWRDHDLSSAYPTAMTLIGIPDWKNCRHIDSFDNIDPLDLAYFSVDFEFPETVRFPTLPVRTANGIVFPHKGNSKCASPELFLALQLKAKIRIKRAVLVPTDRRKLGFPRVYPDDNPKSKTAPVGYIRQSVLEGSRQQYVRQDGSRVAAKARLRSS